MKITRSQLKELIKEELQEVRRPILEIEGDPHGALADAIGEMTVLADKATDAVAKDELNKLIGELNRILYMLG